VSNFVKVVQKKKSAGYFYGNGVFINVKNS